MVGKVVKYNNQKGFGFIKGTSKDLVFVHYTAIKGVRHRTLCKGTKVRFEVARGARGFQAVKVFPLS